MDTLLLPSIYLVGKTLAHVGGTVFDSVQWGNIAGNFEHEFAKWAADQAGLPTIVDAVQKRLLRGHGHGVPPINHDVQRAVRRSILRATMAFDVFWEIDCATARVARSPWAINLGPWLSDRIREVGRKDIIPPTSHADGNADRILDRQTETLDWMLLDILSELHSASGQHNSLGAWDEGFASLLINGWNPKPPPIDVVKRLQLGSGTPEDWKTTTQTAGSLLKWQSAVSEYFLAEFKINPVLHTLIDAQLLLDLKYRSANHDVLAAGIQTLQTELEKKLATDSAAFNAFSNGLNKVVNVVRGVERVVRDEGAATRSLIQSFHTTQYKDTNRSTIERSIRNRQVREFGIIRLIGIPGAATVAAIELNSVFVSPTLQRLDPKVSDLAKSSEVSANSAIEDKVTVKSANKPQRFSVNEMMQASHRTVIVGMPGSGKTTLARYIGLMVAVGRGRELADNINSDCLPLLFNVRSLARGFKTLPSLIELIRMNAPILSESIDAQFAPDMFGDNKIVLIIDGLDECELPSGDESQSSIHSHDPTEWHFLMQWISDLANIYPNLRIIATARPVAIKRQELLKTIEFEGFEICPLSDEQQQSYVRHWCSALDEVESANRPNERQFTRNISKGIGEQLTRGGAIKALAQWPLTLSVLCVLQSFGRLGANQRRSELLLQCIDVLLFEWREAHRKVESFRQDICGTLAAKELRALLQPLAFQLLSDGRKELGRVEIERQFAATLPDIDQDATQASEILRTIRDRSGVLVEGGSGIYSFVHLLFQEFLAGQDCAQRGAVDFLIEKADDPRWHEVIPYAASSMQGSQQTIIRGLLQKNLVSLAVRVMNESTVIPQSLRQEVLIAAMNLSLKKPSEGIAALMNINNATSVLKFYDLVREYKFCKPVEVEPVIQKMPSSKGERWDVLKIARLTARRCHFNYKLTLLTEVDGIGAVSYESDFDASNVLSWRYMSLMFDGRFVSEQMQVTAEQDKNLWHYDPVYQCAVTLDSLDGPFAYSTDVLTNGIIDYLTKTDLSLEQALLAIILADYRLGTCEVSFFTWVLTILEKYPADFAPAVQIGIINKGMKKWQDQLKPRDSELALRLWKRCSRAIMMSLKPIVHLWADSGYIGPIDDGTSYAVDSLVSRASDEFGKELDLYRPFEFDIEAVTSQIEDMHS